MLIEHLVNVAPTKTKDILPVFSDVTVKYPRMTRFQMSIQSHQSGIDFHPKGGFSSLNNARLALSLVCSSTRAIKLLDCSSNFQSITY